MLLALYYHLLHVHVLVHVEPFTASSYACPSRHAQLSNLPRGPRPLTQRTHLHLDTWRPNSRPVRCRSWDQPPKLRPEGCPRPPSYVSWSMSCVYLLDRAHQTLTRL